MAMICLTISQSVCIFVSRCCGCLRDWTAELVRRCRKSARAERQGTRRPQQHWMRRRVGQRSASAPW